MKTLRKSPPAFSLIEVTIALGIAAFCLITVFALLPIGINTNQNAFEQTAAAGIATAIAADLHGTPVVSTVATTSSTSRFQIVIPQAGQSTVPVIGNGSPNFQTMFFTENGAPWNGSSVQGPMGQTASPSTPGPLYRATISFQPEDTTAPSGQFPAPRNKLFRIWILITWPGLADPNPGKSPANFSGSYEVTTALDCN